MIKDKNFFISTKFEHPVHSMSRFYVSRLPRLHRSFYLINQLRSINYKTEERYYDIQLKRINFDLLVVFYTVVVFGSISKAAKHLAVSQPAISMSLRKLENELGSLLFKPFASNNKLLVLTPFGLVLFNRIQRLFQIVEESLSFSKLQASSLIIHKLSLPQSQSKSLILLNQVNKKYLFNLNHKSVLLKFFSRNLTCFHELNLKYFENNLNFIILQKSQLIDKKINLIKTKSVLSKNLFVDKFPTFKTLNSQIFLSINNKHVIEIQTPNAIDIVVNLNISKFIHWGSFL